MGGAWLRTHGEYSCKGHGITTAGKHQRGRTGGYKKVGASYNAQTNGVKSGGKRYGKHRRPNQRVNKKGPAARRETAG